MRGTPRLQRLAQFGTLAVLALALVACAQEYPNTTFQPNSEYGRAIDFLWNRLMFLGTIVFVLVEAALIYVVIKYRRKDETTVPPQTPGNTQLEIIWTLIPAVILVFIAVPTVRTVFETQAPAPEGALEIEVYGHQWWWEFKYPEYGFTTANEIYIPAGRTVNLVLRSKDVVHSFWVPQLAGKRDMIPTRTNYIWFTPDPDMPSSVWNGFCTEYCGASHANMKFRVVTVQPDEFESWLQHQMSPALYSATPAVPAASDSLAGAEIAGGNAVATLTLASAAQPQTQTAMGGSFMSISPDLVPDWAIPQTPLPASIKFDDSLIGDPASGEQLFSGAGTCAACHAIQGNPRAVGIIGPDLTHIGSRLTIGAGLYKNDPKHMARWIKNARVMKPGNLMQTLGKDEYDPIFKINVASGLTDQQIADLVAYLAALK